MTATRRAQSVNSISMSAIAATGLQLQKLGITSVADLTKMVPGFQATDSGYSQPIYFLRGVGFFDTSLQDKPAVTVYTDEVPLPFSPMTVGASFDLQRVEVLKGPQGTLYGQDSTGGAINYIAAKPTNTPEAGVDGSFGRFNDTDLSLFASGPLTDTLTARIAARHEGAEGWQKSYTSPDERNGAKDFSQARLILDWKPASNFKAELNVNGFYDHGQTQAPQFEGTFLENPSSHLDPQFTGFPTAPDNDRAADWGQDISLRKHNKFFQTSLRLDYRVSDDVTITSLTA